MVVCGQFRANPQLARAELFGHKEGAFTGATGDRKGLLELADGDCLFLDEVADLDHDTQRLLMAAIEGRGFHRLGDPQERRSRFRLLSATNRTLEALHAGVLDRDFLDRLAVAVLRVPPLRDCTADLPDLWSVVLQRTARGEELADALWRPFTDHPVLISRLREHPLPGNVRDVQRVAVHLLAALRAGENGEAAAVQALASLTEEPGPQNEPRLPVADLRVHLDAVRQRYIDQAMTSTAGNQSEAARLLGVPRETLRDWLKSGRTSD